MQAENSNMIFHSFSWAFWLGREIVSHKLWQKHHPTRHRSDLLSEGSIRPADQLLEGKGGTVTEIGKWRLNVWSVHKRNSSRGCELSTSKGNCLGWPVCDKSQHELLYWFQCCTVTLSLLMPPPAGGRAGPAKIWMHLESLSAPLTRTQTCSEKRGCDITEATGRPIPIENLILSARPCMPESCSPSK